MDSHEIRRRYIAFFENKGHTFVKGSPVVGDETLLFVNAGMNQFKDVFLGQGKRPYNRAVNSQICIRVSGKHNDLEDVGKDTTHLTSFEMLGNWSFANYYKKEAIEWAWTLLTSEFNIPKSKLYASVYETDDESALIWQNNTDIDPSHILKFGKKENFWEMGETGPCGPCSELHVDLGPEKCTLDTPHYCGVNGDCLRYIELWNLVFIQYNRNDKGELDPLPQTHVDTGAGLERLAAYLQQSFSAYQTDLFIPIIKKIESLSGIPYTDDLNGMSHRVMADHSRTLTFGIADNILPSNEGRGYVLRRLLRRALRYAQKLGFTSPVLHELVEVVIHTLGSHFTHLKDRETLIKDIIKSEEEQFLQTLSLGLKYVNNAIETMESKTLSGHQAFKLYDTYGFPLDLTQLICKEKNIDINMEEFNQALNEQRNKARQAAKDKKNQEKIILNLSDYQALPLFLSDYNDGIARGGEARIVSDPTDKMNMAKHHTATHLLHEALKQELGPHIQQAGSLVETHRLRFDFTHFMPISKDQLLKIETLVNQKIKENLPLSIQYMTLENAKNKGAVALFGEKYDENNVRMVNIEGFSMELCGGTHVKQTGLIQAFKIIQENSSASGIRRIEALAGTDAIQDYEEEIKKNLQKNLETKLKKIDAYSLNRKTLSLPDINTKIPYLTLSLTELQNLDITLDKTLKQLNQEEQEEIQKWVQHQIPEFSKKIKENTLCEFLPNLSFIHALSDPLCLQYPELLTLFASEQDQTCTLVIKVGKQSTLSAKELANTIVKTIGGSGGGNAQTAQIGKLKKQDILTLFSKPHELVSLSKTPRSKT